MLTPAGIGEKIASSLITTTAGKLGGVAVKGALGSKVGLELAAAYDAAIDALADELRPSIPPELYATVHDILRDFLRDDSVSTRLIDAALGNAESSVRPIELHDELAERFRAAGYTAVTLPIDFQRITTSFPLLLIHSIRVAAGRKDRQLFAPVVLARLEGVERSLVAERDRRAKAALRKLREATEAAAADASIVEQTATRDIRLDRIYVARTAESRVVNAIAADGSATPFVVISGDAGNGKTSLLWRIRQTLAGRGEREVWLVKASRLVVTLPHDVRIARDELADAIAEARRSGRIPVALFDTVDVLVHDEANFDALRDLLRAAHEAGCRVVVTTRPAEATAIRRIHPDAATVDVYRYDDAELHAALRTHFDTYYDDPDPARFAEDVARILGAVAAGLPIREVCESPLMLRMLFAIYAPADIPEHINSSRLYREFWERRIATDTRPGSQAPAAGSRDLSGAAQALAIGMLATGTPHLDESAARTILGHYGIARDDLDMLAARDVVRVSEHEVRFFHQTLFEHAAARAFTQRGGASALDGLAARVEERNFDPFLAPVLEQALLLGGDHPFLRDAADRLLDRLLASDRVPAVQSGLAIYALRLRVSPAAGERVRAIVRDRERQALVVNFLHVAANFPEQRAEDLFGLIGEAWRLHDEWRVRERVLELLTRLAAHPKLAPRVRRLIEELQMIDYVLGQSTLRHAERSMRNVLRALAVHEPEWCRAVLERFYVAALLGDRPEGLRLAVLDVFADRAAAFGKQDIATRLAEACDAALPEEGDARKRALDSERQEVLYEAWGRLYAIEWAAQGLSISRMIDDIPYELHIRRRLTALRDALRSASAGDVECAWQWMLHGTSAHGQSAARHLWRPFVADDSCPEESRRVVREHVREVLAAVCLGRDDEATRTLFLQLLDVVSHYASPAAVAGICDGEAFEDPAVWLDQQRLARIIGDGYLARHPGAIAAVARIDRRTLQHEYAAAALLRRLAASDMSDDDARVFMELLEAEDVDWLRDAITREGNRARCARHPRCATLLGRMIADVRPAERGRAIRIYENLVAARLLAPPPIETILDWLRDEIEPPNLGHLARFLGVCTEPGRFDHARVLDVLEPLALDRRAEVSTQALEGFMVVAVTPEATLAEVQRAFEVILREPTDQGRLKNARRLLYRAATLDRREAMRLLQRFLTSPAMASVGRNAMRNLANRTEGAVRAVIAGSTQEERDALLALLPSLDPFLARVIVESLCLSFFENVRDSIQRLLEDPQLDLDLKILIRQQQRYHQRITGSVAWPEVERLIPHA